MIIDIYKSETKASDETTNFNNLSIQGRIDYLNSFSDTERKKFIAMIRKQAVIDAWNHERELIEQGKCTRDWTPEQIENIYALSDKTGNMSINGGTPKIGNFEGHHMLNVDAHRH